MIQAELGVEPADQKLVFAGRELEDGKNIDDFFVEDESTIDLSKKSGPVEDEENIDANKV